MADAAAAAAFEQKAVPVAAAGVGQAQLIKGAFGGVDPVDLSRRRQLFQLPVNVARPTAQPERRSSSASSAAERDSSLRCSRQRSTACCCLV